MAHSALSLSVKDAMVRYGTVPVFEALSFTIHHNKRIALVGKNGAGKSTLMRIITGVQELDAGERWEEAGTSIGYLRQEIVPQSGQHVADFVLDGLPAEEREISAYKMEMITEALQLSQTAEMCQLSGGQLRRAGLAQILVEEPDILLLDEPTNHLDLEAILWLEQYLKQYRGTLVCISHDRTFLSAVTNQVFWLDRGQLKVSPHGFSNFDTWSAALLEQEARELRNRKSLVAQEVEWASRGVKARRKRNIRRLEQVKQLREQLKSDESSYRKATQTISVKSQKDLEHTSKMVAEFYKTYKSFEDTTIMQGFSLRIQRGERIGILGKNGSGKSTFLKLLMGETEPDQGRIKRRKELEFSYFDQQRSDLNPKDTLKKTLCPQGGDYIDVMGKPRHVCGYLKDFLFDPSRVDEKVSTLSGGQKNRLLLARILAHPKSCLILDEPTNDLDMDTLDMLEEMLSCYQGTLIVVSHDRDFLDQIVTRILAFEGDGVIESYTGGYSDYVSAKAGEDTADGVPKTSKHKKKSPASTVSSPAKVTKKLSYKLVRELEQLPDQMTALETEIRQLTQKMADGDFYANDPEGFHQTSQALAQAQISLEAAEARWLELEELQAG